MTKPDAMTRDQARVWMAQNPDCVTRAGFWDYRIDESGVLYYRESGREEREWRSGPFGMHDASYRVLEPKPAPAEPPELPEHLKDLCLRYGTSSPLTPWGWADVVTEILAETEHRAAQVADERIAAAIEGHEAGYHGGAMISAALRAKARRTR